MDSEQIIDLILFIKGQEYRIENDKSVIVWINFRNIKEFTDIFGYDYFCEGSSEVTLKSDSIAFDLADFVDDEEIELIIKKLRKFEE